MSQITWDIPLQLQPSPDLTNLKGDFRVCINPMETEAVVLQTCFKAEFLVAFEILITHNFHHNLLNVAIHMERCWPPSLLFTYRSTLDGIRYSLVEISIDVGGVKVRPLRKGYHILQFIPCPPVINWDIKDSIKQIQGNPELLM